MAAVCPRRRSEFCKRDAAGVPGLSGAKLSFTVVSMPTNSGERAEIGASFVTQLKPHIESKSHRTAGGVADGAALRLQGPCQAGWATVTAPVARH